MQMKTYSQTEGKYLYHTPAPPPFAVNIDSKCYHFINCGHSGFKGVRLELKINGEP